MIERQHIRPEDVGSLEDVLGKDDPLFRKECKEAMAKDKEKLDQHPDPDPDPVERPEPLFSEECDEIAKAHEVLSASGLRTDDDDGKPLTLPDRCRMICERLSIRSAAATAAENRPNDFNDYAQYVRRTMGGRSIAVFTLGLCGEAGEFAEIIKKHIGHSIEAKREQMVAELGDVLWYLTAVAETIEVRLSEIVAFNVEKLKKRYPEGFVEGGGDRS